MPPEPTPRTPQGRDVVARRIAELDDLEPYLDLAREIRREVERVAADESAGAASIEAAIDRFPREERERVTRSVFERLPATSQWAVIERVFDDQEIRSYLADEHEARRVQVLRDAEHHALALRFRGAGTLETRELPTGSLLTLGLFREPDVAVAVRRGIASSNCARRLVLRSEGPAGALRVVEDVFDPNRSYFVTGDYDERTWQAERLESHARVWVGSLSPDGDAEGFTPVLVPGARVDVRSEGGDSRGHLHLGFAMLADDDVFAG